MPVFVTECTLAGIASASPRTVPELCRIPGVAPFMQFCSANEVDLLVFVGDYGR
jgi:hypothetical protein